MADINYFNPEGTNPNMQIPGLSAMWAGQDRQRYRQQASLQDMMMMEKAKEWQMDAPVRASARPATIATNNATTATIGGMKQGQLDQLNLGNQYDRETMGARVGTTNLKHTSDKHGFELGKIKQGLDMSMLMMDALKGSGPAGMSSVVQMLQQRGIDVQNDPVVRHVMSGRDPNEIAARIKQVQQAYSNMDQAYRTSAMVQHNTNLRNTEDNAARRATARQPGEKEHDESIGIFLAEVKEQQPTWSAARQHAEALRRYQAGRYGAQKVETTEQKEAAKNQAQRTHLWHLTKGKFGDKPAKDTPANAMPYENALEMLRKNPTPTAKKFFTDTYGVDADAALQAK